MYLPQGNVGGLVFSQGQNLVATGDLGRALNDNPVLSTMVVFLQAQAGFWFHLYALTAMPSHIFRQRKGLNNLYFQSSLILLVELMNQ